MIKNRFLVFIGCIFLSFIAYSQNTFDISTTPQKYTIADITVEGIKYLQHPPIIKVTGLKVGQTIIIPGPDITNAIQKLWDQGLFSDVKILASKIDGDNIYLVIYLQERARLNAVTFKGVKKHEENDLKDLVDFKSQMQITENKKDIARKKLRDYYFEKGYFNVDVTIKEIRDTTQFYQSNIIITIDKKNRVKIHDIIFHNNTAFSTGKLQRTMKKTKKKAWYILKRSKYIPKDFETDQESIIAKYKKAGYRDIEIIKDTMYDFDGETKNIEITLNEGKKYYFRNITWLGNSIYKTDFLNKVLSIKKGDIYNEELLHDKLYGLEGISSLYLDNGYLFFNAEPIELNIEKDSVDIEIRIYEGQQAVVNDIIVSGNTKTNDRVIYREIRTKPGDLFSRADIIRTQRELATLGYFDPEKMEINPKPNPQNGTVDIEYKLEEKSNDQIELSGGWSGSYITGSVKLILNNFSIKNAFHKDAWNPIPSGDGQNLSLTVTSNPKNYQYYSISFTEPWLGGKKPNALSVSPYYSLRANGYDKDEAAYGCWKTIGASVGLQRDLKKPDDFFTLYNDIGIKRYKLNNYSSGLPAILPDTLTTKNVTFGTSFGRNSIDQPLYPRKGSMFSVRLELTPPYSLFRSDANDPNMSEASRYKWIEYHKWTFKSKFYTEIIDKLVLETRVDMGFLGYYNSKFKSPFERFDVGGDGLSNMSYSGTDVIPVRGYASSALTPNEDEGANLYDKFSLELRYALSLKQEATIYGLVFAEGANAWMNFSDYNPFDIKRSAGFGVRVYVPMMGLIGFDYGYGFDKVSGKSNIGGWNPSFVLGQQF